MSDRKAVAQFMVWIFVLIAGAVILGFFFIIANDQTNRAQEQLTLEALQQVDTILSTQSTGADTYDEVPIPENSLAIVCEWVAEDALISQIEIGGRAQQVGLVAGRNMETDTLKIFSKRLMLPYDVGSVLMISGPRDGFSFVYDESDFSTSVGRILDAIPEQLGPQVFDNRQGLDADAFDTLRVIKFERTETQLTTFTPMPTGSPRDAKYILVTGERPHERGTVSYWTYRPGFGFDQDGDSIEYYGTPMLLALIWQGDAGRATCLAQKVEDQIEISTKLQIERMELLYNESMQPAGSGVRNIECAGKYGTAALEELLAVTQGNSQPTLTGLGDAAIAVYEKNEQLQRDRRCAYIY